MSFDLGHALVVGVGNYKDSSWNALETAADAVGVAGALRDPAVAAYPDDQVRLLCDEAATLAGLIAGLDALAAVPADHTVVIFYAGHGLVRPDGQYYLTAYDTTFVGDDDLVPATALSEQALLQRLRAIRAEKLLLVINACFSGEAGDVGALGAPVAPAAGGAALGVPPSPNLGTRVLATGEGRAVVTACRADQRSYFRRTEPMTFFGSAVTDCLRGANADPRYRYIGLFDFYENVFTRTRDAALGLQAHRIQEPVLNLKDGVGPFAIALVGQAGGIGAALAGDAGDAALGGDDVRQTLGGNTAIDRVPASVVEASGTYQPGMSFAGAKFAVDNRKVIDFGNARIGNIQIGDVAGGDIVKVTISAPPATAAGVRTAADLQATIEKVAADVESLSGAAPADRQDIIDELEKAGQAAKTGDHARVSAKLEAARALLARLGGSIPAAVPISETVAVLVQRSGAGLA